MAGELAHVRTVLFGFDDTLVDSYPGRMAAMGSAFAEAFSRDFSGATFMVFPFRDRVRSRQGTRVYGSILTSPSRP